MSANYCEHCGGRFTTQPGTIEKLCTCDIENLTEQKRGQMEPQVMQKIAEVIDKEIKNLRGTSAHGSCCTCGDCKNFYDDCTCTEIKTLKNIKEKLASNFSA